MTRARGESMVKDHVKLYEKELTCEIFVGKRNHPEKVGVQVVQIYSIAVNQV